MTTKYCEPHVIKRDNVLLSDFPGYSNNIMELIYVKKYSL